MPNSLLFPVNPQHSDQLNVQVALLNTKISETPGIAQQSVTAEGKAPSYSSLSNEWYQSDLSHLTRSLLQSASTSPLNMSSNNTQLLTSTSMIDPNSNVINHNSSDSNLPSRDRSFSISIDGGGLSISWGGW